MKSIVIDKSNVPKNIYYFLDAYKEKYFDWIIGGGFARYIGHKVFNIKWGTNLHIIDYFKACGGDIDFFSTHDVCNSTFASLETEKTISSSFDLLYDYHNSYKKIKTDIVTFKSAFADNSSVSFYIKGANKFNKLKCLNLRKQFITKFNYNNIDEMCENFDITNSQWFIAFNNNKIELIYSEEAKRLDQLELIDINENIANPLLAKRINKYITARGLNNGLNKDSKDNFNHFLVTAATDSWKEDFVNLMVSQDLIMFSTRSKEEIIERTKSNMTFEVLNQLLKLNLLSDTDLSLFIGKWKTIVKETRGVNYSNPSFPKSRDLNNIYTNEYRETDWASHNISLLKQEQQIV